MFTSLPCDTPTPIFIFFGKIGSISGKLPYARIWSPFETDVAGQIVHVYRITDGILLMISLAVV